MDVKNKNRIGYKKTKVGWIPREWEADCIGNLADITTGSKDTQDRVENGKYPFFVRSQKAERIDSYSFEGTAVLTAGDGVGTGKVFHFVEGKFDYHQRVYKISDFSAYVFPRFFFEYFRLNFIRQVRRYSAKNSVDSVRMEMIANMFIPLPPLPEQEAIAGVLECWDRGIKNLELRIEKKRNIKKGLMQKLLSGKQRLPGFSVEWKNMKFSSIAQLSKAKYTPKLEDNRVCLELEHIEQRTGRIIGKTSSICQSSIKNVFRSGNILFGKLRPYLRKYAKPDFDGVCSTEIWVLEGNQNISCNDYIFWLIQTSSFISVANVTSGTKMPRADWNYISRYSFPVAPIEEQKAIAAVLSAADSEIEAMEKKLMNLKDQKKFLLNNLVTGTIRLPKFRGRAKNTDTNGDHT